MKINWIKITTLTSLLLLVLVGVYGILIMIKPSSINNKPNNLPWWDGGNCSNRKPKINEEEQIYGHCGRRASASGQGQKVISMNIHGNKIGYIKGLGDILKIMLDVYPGYFLRLYVDPRKYKERLCPLLMKYEHLHVCDIKNLPSGIGDIETIQRSSWRYSTMGDPQVDVILFRDSDARIIEREVSAVNEWMASKTTMHIMRDCPIQRREYKIFAGTWGLRADLGKMYSMGIEMRRIMNIIRQRMFIYLKGKVKYGEDQVALSAYVWPILRNDVVMHDAYYCRQKEYLGSWPWPTKRNGSKLIVGNMEYRQAGPEDFWWVPDLKCPWECRPPNHKDWIYC